jgi:hypothetical protein
MADENDPKPSTSEPESEHPNKPRTVPDLLKDIKGKNTTRDEIDPSKKFL